MYNKPFWISPGPTRIDDCATRTHQWNTVSLSEQKGHFSLTTWLLYHVWPSTVSQLPSLLMVACVNPSRQVWHQVHITLPNTRSPIEYCEPERLTGKTTGEGERRLDYIRHFPRLPRISHAPLYYGRSSLGSSKTSMPKHCYIVKRRTHAAGLCACEREENTVVCVRLSSLFIMRADKPFRQTGRWAACEITFSFAFQ